MSAVRAGPGRFARAAASGLAVLALAFMAWSAQAVELRFQRLAAEVWVHVGELGARTADNEGLNANIGLVVTPAGAVLIDSGATWASARQIHEAVRRITPQPLRWVINTGGQDHRWLGNGYFQSQGVETIGHAAGEADMRNRGHDHVVALRQVLGAKLDGTVPALPTRWLTGRDERLELGGTVFEILHRGGAHTPGDVLVWLPQKQLLFSGDVVYLERLLGVIPVSRTRAWLDSLAAIEALQPAVLVPGHGRVGTLADARADTLAYLQALRSHMRRALDEGQDLGEAVRRFDGRPFLHLLNARELMPGNASRTYLEMEME